jgi:predicted small metal-binding protein
MKCDFVAKATTDDEVLKQAAAHARKAYQMAKVKAAIRTV